MDFVFFMDLIKNEKRVIDTESWLFNKNSNNNTAPEEEQKMIAEAFDPDDKIVQFLKGWELEESSVVVGKAVGEGAFGVVKEALLDGEKIAVKEIKHGGINEISLQCFLQEANFLRQVSHPNIVPFRGYVASDKFLLLTMGFADGGTIKSYLAIERENKLDWSATAYTTSNHFGFEIK